MKKLVLISLAASATLFGAGYKIPENSINSMALGAAYVAHAHGADASYFNPANMAFESKHALEVSANIIAVTATKYDSNAGDASISAESELKIAPSLHYVSPSMGNATLGLSIVVPAGNSKRWNDQPAKGFAKEFTLRVIEINPTVGYKINDTLAVGAGVRLINSSGTVKSQSTASRDLAGESWDYGYNFALSYKPTESLALAATYRSNVDLTEVGTAKLYFPDNADYSGTKTYDGDASVMIPLPAALNLAVAYTFESITTVEFVYEHTFWSAYDQLDFGYESSIGALTPSFDDPIAKDWKDTSTYRLGVTQAYEKWTAMAGVSYDESPIPEETLNFETPGSDAWIVSLGGRYELSPSWSLGAAGLVSIKEDREVVNDNVDGTFSDTKAYLFTLGAEYTF
ncbi:MAG: outer membrane protein transport protein [Campylobacterota bacterium]|nr:outer membrane protein transport protein [Campylobacterota bacterium]